MTNTSGSTPDAAPAGGNPGIWDRNAAQWQLVGSPLRPSEEDIGAMESALREWHAVDARAAPRALLLGMTPELVAMAWPGATRLVAADLSPAMIRSLWSGARPDSSAICADWAALPLAAASRDIIAGDASLNALACARQYRVVLGELRRVIDAQGILVLRLFIRPDEREPVPVVFEDLRAGRIGSFHAFKWRLAMAMHGALDEGVCLHTVWETWNAAVPDRAALAARLGWPLQTVLTIEAYRGQTGTRYTFPTLAEIEAEMSGGFDEIGRRYPRYELGERCPTFIFRPRPRGRSLG